MNFLHDSFQNDFAPMCDEAPRPTMIGEYFVRQLSEISLCCCLADTDGLEDIILALVRSSSQDSHDILRRLIAIAGPQIEQRAIRALADGEGRLWQSYDDGNLECLI